MANANDIRLYDRALELAKTHGLGVKLYGDGFVVNRKSTGTMLGVTPTVEALYHLLCGYDWAASLHR